MKGTLHLHVYKLQYAGTCTMNEPNIVVGRPTKNFLELPLKILCTSTYFQKKGSFIFTGI